MDSHNERREGANVPVCECRGPHGYLQFPEPITKVYIREVVGKDGSRVEEMIVNDKWKMVPTGNPKKPFKKIKLRKKANE